MGLVSEFKTFIHRGNAIELAVGVIMGVAFGKIVNSLVADVIMPPIGYMVGGINFTDLALTLGGTGVTIKYGTFLQTLFDFLIVAVCIFLLVKAVNLINRKEEEKPAEPSSQEKLLMEIRDLLKVKV